RSTKDCLCGGKVEVVKQGVHGEAQGLVMLVDRAPGLGLAAELAPDGAAGTRIGGCGEERLEDVLAQHDQSGNRPEAPVEHLVASSVTRLVHESLGAQLLQVVGSLARAVVAEGPGADLLDT